jgi:hypothetical protein
MEKGIKVSYNKVVEALKRVPDYVMQIRRRRKFSRRQYQASGANR